MFDDYTAPTPLGRVIFERHDKERQALHLVGLNPLEPSPAPGGHRRLARIRELPERNAPVPRAVEPPRRGRVIATPQVGGRHHRYTRAA